jgi:hypothetical protein
VLAAGAATRVSPLGIVERHRDFFGPVGSRVANGFLDFYDVQLPFDSAFHPEMHAVLLLAAFSFTAALGLAAVSRRPLAAVLVLLAGAGWPATLLSDHRDLLRGSVILAAALLLLAGFRPDARRVVARAALLGATLVAVALAASTQPAVAKTEFLNWRTWDPYHRAAASVGVRYVWDSSYSGFTFPRKVTTVFTVKAAPLSTYWRAATLDVFDGVRWVEEFTPAQPALFGGRTDVTIGDPLSPLRALDASTWRQAHVEIAALADDHLARDSARSASCAGAAGSSRVASTAASSTTCGASRRSRRLHSSHARSRTIRPPRACSAKSCRARRHRRSARQTARRRWRHC